MSNGTNEPLPGLLDDPQFQSELPWTDFHLAPLRNPAPQRNVNAPSPLEPIAGSAINAPPRPDKQTHPRGATRNSNITPSDVLQARESRKPHLAISELVDDNDHVGGQTTQLPSFVSLSVVEKSPTQTPQALGTSTFAHTQKRPRLDQDAEHTSHDLGRQLPRPAQREHTVPRPAPLLPAMVTGLHEPPPSAALLPSMDPDRRPGASRSATSSKIQVKDILTHVDSRSPSPAPVVQRQLPVLGARGGATRSIPHLDFTTPRQSTEPTPPSSAATPVSATIPSTSKDGKTRRVRRKWTDDETRDLLLGVKKHGVGKWKQILTDSTFSFDERSAVDLKDRYRVCSKDDSPHTLASLTSNAATTSSLQRHNLSSTTSSPISPKTPSHTPPPTAALSSRTSSPVPITGSTSNINTNILKPRRKRRAWTAIEDASLLRGVAKHGFQWTAIHDDPTLELQHRRATDLRDRIRNKYPDGYKLADVKPLRSEVKKAERERERGKGYVGDSGGGSGKGDPGDGDDVDEEGPMEDDRELEDFGLEGGKTKAKGKGKGKEKEKSGEAAGGGGGGITLPSLDLDEADEMDVDGGTMRLRPLMTWDD